MSEENYSKRSFPALLVLNSDETECVAGMFYYVVDGSGNKVGLCSCLPNAKDVGDPSWGATMFTGHGRPNKEWTWDGNVEKPTLKPSIHRTGHWHGHLQNGFFKSC